MLPYITMDLPIFVTYAVFSKINIILPLWVTFIMLGLQIYELKLIAVIDNMELFAQT